jgi:hypothetical protein
LAGKDVRFYVHLGDYEGKEHHNKAQPHEWGEEKEPLKEVLPPLTYYVVRYRFEKAVVLPSKNGCEDPIHIRIS